MKRQEAIEILEKHKEHLKELISEGEEYYHYVSVVEVINCILKSEMKELEVIKIDNISDKIHFLDIMIRLYDDLEKDANDTREAKGFKVYKCKLCEIANDYKNIEEFLNDNSVG